MRQHRASLRSFAMSLSDRKLEIGWLAQQLSADRIHGAHTRPSTRLHAFPCRMVSETFLRRDQLQWKLRVSTEIPHVVAHDQIQNASVSLHRHSSPAPGSSVKEDTTHCCTCKKKERRHPSRTTRKHSYPSIAIILMIRQSLVARYTVEEREGIFIWAS